MNNLKSNNYKLNYLFVVFFKKLFPFSKLNVVNNEIFIYIPANHLKKVAFFLKNHSLFQFKCLIDICAIDYVNRNNRFEIVYNLLSISQNMRVNLSISLNEFDTIESLTGIFKSANWAEREAWDMFGIFFAQHPDMRRILTDYGFKGHPLRKDFPLLGFVECLYSDFDKKIRYKIASFAQSYRTFNFNHFYNF